MLMYYLLGIIFFFFSFFFMYMFMYMYYLKYSIFIEWFILEMNSSVINMLLYFDWMTMLFIFTIFLISSMIMFYCCEYMMHDIYMNRFFYLMMIFILSMFLLIISPNMVTLLVGWDGLGLSSYCLIVYYQNYLSYNSGMLTILMNRIGDILIILSISMILMYGSWNFMNYNNYDFFILMFIIFACFTKSAQFPFSHWLPAAMAAPTPVSSLVHSSTLVTAGIYLLIRFEYLMFKNLYLMEFITVISLITMMFASFSAMYTYDFKKIIAFSTLSQLGLMMLIYSMKDINLTFFHMIIHAMFKSMMFMCSGVWIHQMLNFQDIRFMSNTFNMMPMTFMIFMISNFSLCGFPFLSGFFSKDKILEFIFFKNLNYFMYMFLYISTGLTIIYSFRLMYYLLNKNTNFIMYMKIYDSKIMNYSMLILLILTVFLGFILNWLIFMNIELYYFQWHEKLSILFICLLYFILINIFYKSNFKYNKLYFLSLFFGEMWFMSKFMIMNKYIFNFSKFWKVSFEKGWSEFFMKKFFLIEMFKMLNYLNFYNKLIIMLMFFSYMLLLMLLF